MKELSIKGSVLTALNRIASTDETRIAINGVRVEFDKDGYTLLATDGRRLVAVHANDDKVSNEPISFTIPSLLINALPRSMRNGVSLTIEYDEEHVVIKSSRLKLELHSAPIKATYPNWRRIIPDEWPKGFNSEALKVNYEYLQSIFKAFKDLVGNTRAVVIAQAGEMDPICMRAGDVMAFLMPMRFGDDATTMPQFITKEQGETNNAGIT